MNRKMILACGVMVMLAAGGAVWAQEPDSEAPPEGEASPLVDEEVDEEPAEDDMDDEAAERARLARVLFAMTDHARREAGRGNFRKWIRGKLPTHRRQANALLGTEQLIDDFVERTKDCETFDEVELAATNFEVTYGIANLQAASEFAGSSG